MGRAGGGGGRSGGSSFGGGGGRSSGGRSGGAGGHRSGYSGMGGSSFRPTGYHGGGYYSRRPGGVHIHYGAHTPAVWGAGIGLAIVAVTFLMMVFLIFGTGSGNITKSTVAREPLASNMATDIGFYFDDQVAWLGTGAKTQRALQNFEKATGVAPVLVLADKNAEPNELSAYAKDYYEANITDEAHFVFLFNEYNGSYRMEYVVGAAAKSVMDTEAMDILMDYVETYYYSDMTEDEMFAKAFDETAERIMKVTKSPWPIVVGLVIVLGIACVIFATVVAKNKREKEKAEETERILNTDIEDL